MFGFYLDFSSHRTREGGAQVHILSKKKELTVHIYIHWEKSKLLGLDWENVVCQPIFALSNTLLIVIIKFIKFNVSKRKNLKQSHLGKNALL